MFKKITIHLLIVILAFKALLPVGTMPDMSAAANGAIKITICANGQSKEILVDQNNRQLGHNQNEPDKSKHTPHDKPCAFGQLAGKDILAAIPTIHLLSKELAADQITIIAFHVSLPMISAAWPHAPPAQA